MDVHYELNGTSFVWHAKKAASNPVKHDGITFEQAAAVFFDPFFALLETGRNDEARDAIVGFDASSRLLLWCIIISARRATNEERRNDEHS